MAYRTSTIEVYTDSPDYRAAMRIVEVAELPVATAGHVVVKNHYVGVNTVDGNLPILNRSHGSRPLPYNCGLEGVGEVVAVGEEIGAFTEYIAVPAATALKVPVIDSAVLPVLVQGISGAVALEQEGQIKSGETVLVTAAAGGTGQFVVQLAKLAGNHVIGTTSSNEKAAVLKALGCDRVINNNKEDIGTVLKTEYPNGVDLVFETVGGETFKAAVQNIAARGRVIVFGFISDYADADKGAVPLLARKVNYRLLEQSASVSGFNLGNYLDRVPDNLATLIQRNAESKLKPGVDETEFKGLEAIPDALDYLFARKNVGKLAVKLVKVHLGASPTNWNEHQRGLTPCHGR